MGKQLDIYDVLGEPDPNAPPSPRIGSLFSGVAGLDLAVAAHFGAEHAWLCEDDPERIAAEVTAAATAAERSRLREHAASVALCRAVLARRFPGVPVHRDVRTTAQFGHVDILCGGFPCQPASVAGKRGGSADSRWLWPEMMAAIRQTSPRIVVAENVRGLLSLDHGRLFGQVLADLLGSGYAVRWLVLGASACGAPHRRERVFILAERVVLDAERMERPPWPPFAVLAGSWRQTTGDAAFEQRWPKIGLAVGDAVFEQRWPTPMRHDGTGGPGGNHGDLQRDVNWPTPTASERKGGAVAGNGRIGDASWATPQQRDMKGARRAGRDLSRDIELWATPLSSEGSTKRGSTMRGRGAQGAVALGEQVRLLATPTKTDAKASGSRSLDAGKAAHPVLTLTDQAVRGRTSYDRAEWPTPTRAAYGSANNGCPGDGRAQYATAGRPSLEAEGALRLNPDWVECLMNLPIGWTDPEREPAPWPGWPAGPTDAQHAYEPPRTTDEKRLRRQRLAVIGNAVVPQQARLALKLLGARW